MGTGSPSSVAGSPVYARDGTWHVPQDCFPDADRLLSKNIALPATAAADCVVCVVDVDEKSELPPQPTRIAVNRHRNGNATDA
jgi:hypothetical protein